MIPGTRADGGRPDVAARYAGLPETPDATGAFPRLSATQIQRLAAFGWRRPTAAGDVLIAQGERSDQFYVVLSGSVVVGNFGSLDRTGRDEPVDAEPDVESEVQIHGAGRFLGELGLLEGQPAFVSSIVTDPGDVLAISAPVLREVVQTDPAIGDLILRAYLIRRSILIGSGAGLRIVGSCLSPDTRRVLEFAARNRLPHRLLDLEKDRQAEALLEHFGLPVSDTPLVVLNSRHILRNPDNAALAQVMGLRPAVQHGSVCDLLVIGSGPAGLAASVYGASDGLSVIVRDGIAAGGQASTASRIENYLGFPSGISGAELAERAIIQARKFGALIGVSSAAVRLGEDNGLHVVDFNDGDRLTARAVILATGVRYRRLPVPGIEAFEGTSVYYAATFVEARSCRLDPVAVVGGGNSAGQAALFLAAQSPRVYLLVRGPDLAADMSRYLIDQLEHHHRVEILLNTEVAGLSGEKSLSSVDLVDNKTGEKRRIDARALFVFVGASANTRWLEGTVRLDEKGHVVTGGDAEIGQPQDIRSPTGPRRLPLETSRSGVFAAGDVRSGSIKRVASAAGEGSMAVRMVHEHLAATGR